MNIPTPAVVKKQTEARKAREEELASSLANAKDKMPPTKGAPKSSGTRPFDPSASSPKDKGSRDRSSNSSRSRKKTSSPSTSSTRKTTTSSSEPRSERSSISTTTRKKSSTQRNGTGTANANVSKSISPETKKPFVRPDHLTQRPLRDNEALLNLRKQLEKPARGQFKREYRVGGRRNGKSQGLKNKKENN